MSLELKRLYTVTVKLFAKNSETEGPETEDIQVLADSITDAIIFTEVYVETQNHFDCRLYEVVSAYESGAAVVPEPNNVELDEEVELEFYPAEGYVAECGCQVPLDVYDENLKEEFKGPQC